MTRPAMRVTSVVLGAPNPRELAHFYQRLLEWDLVAEEGPRPGSPPEDGWAMLRPPPGEIGPRLSFEFEPYYRRPVWPSEPGEA